MSAHITAPTQQVSEWLSNFGNALDRADFDAAANLFQEEGYWRDLVSLTWNIKTLEGRENIKEMLKATIPEAKPSRWQVEGDATSDNGVISGRLTFETAVSRGKGQIRLRDGKCWTCPWEGELRNMWKPTRQSSLWFQGGNLHQSRHYSQFLQLQIKARMEGISTPVYGLSEVHHLS